MMQLGVYLSKSSHGLHLAPVIFKVFQKNLAAYAQT
jgi:hypothetical protein